MAYIETADLRARKKKNTFLGDATAIGLPIAGAVGGSFLGNPMLGAQLGNMAGQAIGGAAGMSDVGLIGGQIAGMGAGFLGNKVLPMTNQTVMASGGNLPQLTNYLNGNTHEQNSLGGVPVDAMGNPSPQNPVGLVEQGEVGYKLPNDETGYIFSNRLKIPGSKTTFADEAKKIVNKYKNRLGEKLDRPDKLAKEALDAKMAELKQAQEIIKQEESDTEVIKKYGGYLKKLVEGGMLDLPQHGGGNQLGYGFDPETGKFIENPNELEGFYKGIDLKGSYTGYAAQAATRIPQLFTKAEGVNYDRVTPETIDLSKERAGLETSRNQQLGFLKRQAGLGDSPGQVLNYLSSAVPSVYNQFDTAYGQSIGREEAANVGILNQAKAQNAQIQMAETEARARERDAVRSIRDQSLADLGKIGLGAMTAKGKAAIQYNMLKAMAAQGDFKNTWGDQGQYMSGRDIEKDSKLPTIQDLGVQTSNTQQPDIQSFIIQELLKANNILPKKAKGGYLKKKGKK